MGLIDQIIDEYRSMDNRLTHWFTPLDILYGVKVFGIGILAVIIMLPIISILWFGYVTESDGMAFYSDFVAQLLNLSENELQVFTEMGTLRDESIFLRIIENDKTGFLIRVVIVVLLSVFLLMVALLILNSVTTKSDLKKDAKYTQINFEYDRYRLVETVKWCGKSNGLCMDNQVEIAKVLTTLYETLKSQTDAFKGRDAKSGISFAYFFNCMTLCFSCSSLFLTLWNNNMSAMMIVLIIIAIVAGAGIAYLTLRMAFNKPQYRYFSDLSNMYLKKYFMTLLEDIVFFKVPVKECDIDGRVAAWKEKKEIPTVEGMEEQ